MSFTLRKKLGAVGVFIALVASSSFAAPQDEGVWSEPFEADWPLETDNMLITPQGKVLTIGAYPRFGVDNSQLRIDIWDPKLGTGESSHRTIETDIPGSLWQYKSVLLPDSNNVLIAGGTEISTSINNVGSFLFNTETNVLNNAANTEATNQLLRRLTSSLTVLPSGEVLLSGSSFSFDDTVINSEIYTPSTDQWRTLTGASDVSGDWVLPNGEILISNQFNAEFLDVTGSGSVTRSDDVSLRQFLRGNPVMYRPGKFYEAGVSYTGFGPVVVDLDERDFSMRSLNAQRVPDRSPLNGTILLPTGDAMSVVDMNMQTFRTSIDPRLEIWNAATENWSLMADDDPDSSILRKLTLLKDGRVLAASGFTSYKTFSPPYLFNSSGELAERPQIISAPAQGTYSNEITVNHSSDNNISRVTLLSQPRESNAGFGARVGQRFIELDFEDVTNGANVSLPDSANIAPPGYYLMYLIDDKGVPSEGHMISLNVPSSDTSAYPTATDDYATATDGATITIDVLANDTGNSLTLNPPNAWSLRGGNVALVDNKLTYKPKAGFTGEDNIWYTFVDSLGRVNSGKVTITVNANNSPYPTASEDNVETTTTNATTIDVLANDNGNGLVLHAPNAWSLKGGTVELVDNQLVYTSKAGFVGNDNIWYVFEDSQGRINSGQVNITVSSGGTTPFPVANADSYTTSKGIGKNLDILSNDTASGGIAIDTLYEYTANGGTTYKTPEGLVWYTPKAGFTGEDNFWYVMVDSEGRKNSAKVVINVNP